MANSRQRFREINAGSMADIAFLLLIFFLVVSTMENNVGMNRKLAKLCPTNDCSIDIHARNLLTIKLNNKNELLVNNELLPLTSLKEKVTSFLDNNGDQTCSFCNGKQLDNASDLRTDDIQQILIPTHKRRTTASKRCVSVSSL